MPQKEETALGTAETIGMYCTEGRVLIVTVYYLQIEFFLSSHLIHSQKSTCMYMYSSSGEKFSEGV